LLIRNGWLKKSLGAKKMAAANSDEKLPSSEPPSSHIPRDSTPDIFSGDGTPTHSTEEDIDSSSHDHQCQDAAESTHSLMQHYQPTNKTIRARHPSLFKNDTYCFQPIDELVLSMPYNSMQI
jgi:hypothetical protein